MKSATASSDDLTALPGVKVLLRSLENNRLGQSILLHGADLSALEQLAIRLAAVILNIEPGRVAGHPDAFFLRTRGRARQITIGQESERSGRDWPPNTMRRLIHDLNLSPKSGFRKVGIIVEADRMNPNTSNAFLKTLEEPQPDTTLLLLTTRPHDLLDTIRSRCLQFPIPLELASLEHDEWLAWLEDYQSWLDSLHPPPANREAVARVTMTVFALVLRFQNVRDAMTRQIWEQRREGLSEDWSDEEKDSLQAGIEKQVRQRLLADIERATHEFATIHRPGDNDEWIVRLGRVISALEHVTILSDSLNLQESTALESFLLRSLRIWTRG